MAHAATRSALEPAALGPALPARQQLGVCGLQPRQLACTSPSLVEGQRGDSRRMTSCSSSSSHAAFAAAATTRKGGPRTVTSVPAPQPATPALLTPERVGYLVLALTALHGAIFAMMLVSHHARPVRSFMRSLWPFLPFVLGYGLLLANSWSPDTLSTMMPGSLQEGLKGFNPQFFPRMESIAALFQRPSTAASWLVHVWAINLFLGRTIFVDGVDQGIPVWHSLALACVFGPLGMLAHMATKAFWKPAPKPVVGKGEGGQGTITIFPYDT